MFPFLIYDNGRERRGVSVLGAAKRATETFIVSGLVVNVGVVEA